MVVSFEVNGTPRTVDVDEDTPLLWVLRDELHLTGTKYGCGLGVCGACTVHLNGAAARSCVIPMAAAGGMKITTIEALAPPEGLHPVQAAWIEHQVPQCGYCQSGMIMAVSSLLARNPHPTDEEIAAQVDNICRCGTYARIRKAIRSLTGPAPESKA